MAESNTSKHLTSEEARVKKQEEIIQQALLRSQQICSDATKNLRQRNLKREYSRSDEQHDSGNFEYVKIRLCKKSVFFRKTQKQ